MLFRHAYGLMYANPIFVGYLIFIIVLFCVGISPKGTDSAKSTKRIRAGNSRTSRHPIATKPLTTCAKVSTNYCR